MSGPFKITESEGEEERLRGNLPPVSRGFSGHVISVEPEDSRTIPPGEKLFLSHLKDCFEKEPEGLLSEHEVAWQYVTTDALFNTKQVEALTLNNSLIQSVLGLGVPGLAVTSIFSFFNSKTAQEKAKRALDAHQAAQAKTKQGMAMSEFFAGASGVVEKPLLIHNAVRGVGTGLGAASATGQAAFLSGLLGTASYFFLFFFFGASFWNSLQTVWEVEEKITADGVDPVAVLQEMIRPTVADTLAALKEVLQKEEPKSNYEDRLRKRLGTEALSVTKDFLRAMNTDKEHVHSFDEAARALLGKIETRVKANENALPEDLKLTPAELIGLESLHVNRIEAAKKKVESTVGSTAYKALLNIGENPTEEQKEELLKLITKGINNKKILNIAGVVTGMVASSVMAAAVITACIACPPFGLIVASAIFTLAAISFITYFDVKMFWTTRDLPPGEYDARMNTARIFFAVAGIAAVCAVSGASLGTVPAAVALVAVSAVAVTSVFRAYDLRRRRLREESLQKSEHELQDRVRVLKDKEGAEEIKRIVLRKLARSDLLTKEEKKEKKEMLYELIDVKDTEKLEQAIEEWKKLEKEALAQLKRFMEELSSTVEQASSRSWEEYIKHFFYADPSVGTAF